MNKREDFLVEIHTEELPPKSLLKLAEAFKQQIQERLQKAELAFAEIKLFATPRRLAVLVKDLTANQPEQTIERKGPALSAAFDAQGKATPACEGFARSCNVTVADLITLKNAQGEWVGHKQILPGKSALELLPTIIEQALMALPIPKRMRWGASDVQFIRPIHSVLMLYGEQIVPGKILGFTAGRVTYGHRFHAPDAIAIPHAADYEKLLKKAYVIVDFAARRAEILTISKNNLHKEAELVLDEGLVDEVTGLVEWPVALLGSFDKEFLQLPAEVLISSMREHQRYFPIKSAKENKLLSNFITISNIQSRDPQRVIHGNERVLRARLSDAAFFYASDKKDSLEQRIDHLKTIVFQAKLGTLFDKAERLSKLAAFIAEKINVDTKLAARVGMLAKTDLTTNMVGEFPELQGVMGYYYALHAGENNDAAVAMKEQYLPRFAGDVLPANSVGQVLAMADRIDTLVGAFAINQIPTADKDPYGLRRAAGGILRILIEQKINLDLKQILEFSLSCYTVKLENPAAIAQILNFLQERLRAWYQEQNVPADVFASVAALGITNPLDMHARIKAVQVFKKLNEAEALSAANKRVSNIIAKYTQDIAAKKIDPAFFENAAEKELAQQLEAKSQAVARLYQLGKYDEVLLQLAELRKPIDDFFDHVMVMTEDKAKRENRLLLLSKLRALFLQVADIALLQQINIPN